MEGEGKDILIPPKNLYTEGLQNHPYVNDSIPVPITSVGASLVARHAAIYESVNN
jgi:hypothetical protein